MGAPDREAVAAACPRCGAAIAAGACPTCAPAPAVDPAEPTAIPLGPPPDYGVEARLLACETCGTRLAGPADGAVPRCPLCGDASLVPRAIDASGPTRAAPFAVPPARAQAGFLRWLARQRLAPARWVELARARGLRAVYLPLWTVDATLRSRWSAEVAVGPFPLAAAGSAEVPSERARGGERVPNAPGPRRWKEVAGERTDRFVESWPAVPLPPDAPAFVARADAGDQLPWTPGFLAGRAAVIPAGGPDDAWRAHREALFERAREACAADVPGEAQRSLRVETVPELADVAGALVPVYVAAIPWRGRVHRYFVDGRDGRAGGEAPHSAYKLAALVAAATLAVAAAGAVLANGPPPAAGGPTSAAPRAPAATTTPPP